MFRGLKGCVAAAAATAALLAAAAVWFGSLNQDEGWYLYAAELAGEGKMPYRDFFYTQGPLMPQVYAVLAPAWERGGLLGARILTLAIGLAGMAAFAGFAARIAPAGLRREAAAGTAILLACNLYHVYFNTIPKTYALAGLATALGFLLLALATARRLRFAAAGAGLFLAFASGARISLGALLASTGIYLLATRRRNGALWLWFGLGGAAGLAAVYGPYLADAQAFEGLCAAQAYHAARGGFSPLFTAGSASRLVRWYVPAFAAAAAALAAFAKSRKSPDPGCLCAAAGFAAVFAVQMLAPFPYEDYHVPVMGLFAAAASASFLAAAPAQAAKLFVPAVLALSLVCAAGSPLLEKWTTDGQDRFWTIKKEKSELARLRETARKIEKLDPGGKTLLTQDLYLAVETGRKVPEGLEMGPFSMMSPAEWKRLLSSAPCPVAAMSGYSFAIDPPVCGERPLGEQLEFWRILREKYALVETVERFGQNSTPLLLLERKKEGAE